MSDRYTRKDCEAVFSRLLAAIGGRQATSYHDVGGYRLDCNPTYGGYNVERITNDRGAITHPFGYRKMPARQFCETMFWTLDVLEERERIANGSIAQAS